MSELVSGFDFEPSGNTIIGGNISYNSRYGVNFRYGNDNTQLGGQLEHNLETDIAVGNSYGVMILNPMAKNYAPLITTVATDPDNSRRNIYTYPNHILVRGRDYGNGLRDANGIYTKRFNALELIEGVVFSSDFQGLNFIFDKKWGGTGAYQSFVRFKERVHLNTKNAVFGTESPNTDKGIWFYPQDNVEGREIINLINGDTLANGGQWTQIFSAKGANSNSALSAMRIRANSTTSRSINAGGTVNTSGAIS